MDKTVTLTLTSNCNLSCIYCYENHNVHNTMSFDVAKKILNTEFKNLEPSDRITIDFFGGEPFLQFNLIKQIVEYVEIQYEQKHFKNKYRFFATTNGTLIHGEIKHFLNKHKNFYVGLSLDGTEEMQNINRSNSFNKIDLDFFVNMYPDQPIKMTISNLTLSNLAEGVIFAHNKGFKISCNLAYGIDWKNRNHKITLLKQLDKLSNFYLSNPKLQRASILSRDISNIGYLQEDKQTVQKWCGTGTAMRTYDTDGKRYPCQFFMPISCGDEKALKAWDIDFNNEISIEWLDEKCQTCVVRDFCPSCYGSNYFATGNIYSKDSNLCELEKITFYANACLLIQLWDKGYLKNLTDDELSATIFAARKIIESFKSEINI